MLLYIIIIIIKFEINKYKYVIYIKYVINKILNMI